MRKIFKIITLLTFLSFFLSCSLESRENYEDLKKIKIGMSIKNVKNIMRHNYIKKEAAIWDSTKVIYYYNSPYAASDYYKIVISKKDSLVKEIGFGD